MTPREPDPEAWLQRRPWFALYGLRLKQKKEGDEDNDEEEEVSLDNNHFFQFFERLSFFQFSSDSQTICFFLFFLFPAKKNQSFAETSAALSTSTRPPVQNLALLRPLLTG